MKYSVGIAVIAAMIYAQGSAFAVETIHCSGGGYQFFGELAQSGLESTGKLQIPDAPMAKDLRCEGPDATMGQDAPLLVCSDGDFNAGIRLIFDSKLTAKVQKMNRRALPTTLALLSCCH